MQSQTGAQVWRGACPRAAHAHAGRRSVAVSAASWGDKMRDFAKGVKRELDFESWAPRSSQAWRLGQTPTPLANGPKRMGDDDVELLNQRLAAARAAPRPAAPDGDAAAAADAAEEPSTSQRQPSFLESTDGDVADALNQRISQVAGPYGGSPSTSSSSSSDDSDAEDGEEEGELTGALIRDLMLAKWGRAHDVSFVRNNLPLGKVLVCLNVYSPYLGQRSFKMGEEEYLEKLDGIALCLQAWGQSARVRGYLAQPARPRKGLPAKPIIGTAISIQLDLDDATIDEWFPER